MDTGSLLAELENETHNSRVKRMIALGRQARTDAATAALLQNLANNSGFYERLLALFSCHGSSDGAHVLRSLADESRFLRNLAVKMVASVCTDEQTLSALANLTRKSQTVLLRTLFQHQRRAIIDVFLDELAANADERFSLFLFFGTKIIVQKYLESVSPRWGTNDWVRLAKFHPDIAFARLHNREQAQTASDPRLLLHVNAVLPALSQSQPDHALTLVRDLMHHETPAQIELQCVAKRKINEVADLLLTHEDGAAVWLDASRLAPRLTEARLLALLEYRPTFFADREAWLSRVSPDLRGAIFALAGNGWQSKEGVIPTTIIALLPRELREAEACRHLALPAFATRPTTRLAYASFLPWDDAHALLDPFLRNPDPDLRALALSALIGVARYHRARLPEVLTLVHARANEQDPLRRAMLAALAALPPSRWQTSHLEELGQIIHDALNAADLSPATASEAEKIVVALVPFHPEWAASWISTLAQSRGQMYFSSLGDRLTNADVQRIAPALLPVLQAWATRERDSLLVQAASSLGRRLRVFDGLADVLERVLTTTRKSYIASQILSLLATHRRDRMKTLIPALLESDPSVITLWGVYDYLHRKRQDLLTPFLGQQAYKGRFSTGKTRFVLPILTGFNRWTPYQQRLFADTLTHVTHDKKRDTPALLQVISQLAALPSVAPSRLIELADAQVKSLAVRDAALRALARLDGGQGIPVLVEALSDVRARVAIYALRSTLLEMPASRALTLLQAVPTGKVTVAKEVLRLLGELKTPAVYPLLLEMDTRPLHRDVRVALLRALWDHLEREETWPILNHAATNSDPAIASGVVWIPTDRLSPLAQQNLLALMATLLSHPDALLRVQVLSRCVGLPLPDPDQMLLPLLLARLHSLLPDECDAAARAVFATYATNAAQNVDVICKTVAQVRHDRRALQATLNALHAALTTNRSRLHLVVRGVLDALHDDPLTVLLRAKLAVAGLPWNEVKAYLAGLADTNELDAESLMATVQAVEASGPRAGAKPGANSLQGFESALADSPDARLRRLGFAALLAQSTQVAGWTNALRTRLDWYRRDPAPLVAAAAQFFFPPPKEETTSVS